MERGPRGVRKSRFGVAAFFQLRLDYNFSRWLQFARRLRERFGHWREVRKFAIAGWMQEKPLALHPVVQVAECEPKERTKHRGLRIWKRIQRCRPKTLARVLVHEPAIRAEHEVEQSVM